MRSYATIRGAWTAAMLLAALASPLAGCASAGRDVRPSRRPRDGIVRVRDGALELDGAPYRFIGVNVYSLASAAPGTPGFRCGNGFDDASIDALFGEVAAMGGTVVRFDAFQSFTAGGTDLSRLDAIVAAAERRGIRLIVTLENQWPDCTEGGYKFASWYREGYRRPYGAYRLSFRDYARTVARRYRGRPGILMWQLMNEAESRTVTGIDDPEAVLGFAEDMAAVVKEADPTHLLSLGTIGIGRPGTGSAFYALLHEVAGIDVVEAHDYDEETEAMPRDVWLSLLAAREIGKPFFIGEVGISSPPFPPDRRATLIGEKLEAAWAEGAAGCLVWSYRAGDGDGKDFDARDPLARTLRRFAANHHLGNGPP